MHTFLSLTISLGSVFLCCIVWAERIWIGWPVALRRVRAWLEPYVLLMRYWRAWSEKAPPEPLQALLDWLWIGKPLYLYCR